MDHLGSYDVIVVGAGHAGIEAAHAAAHLVADEKDAEIQRLKTQVQELSEKLASAEEALEDANEEAGSAEARSGEAQAEIVRLKAKLYDYMTAGA